MPRIRTIKPDFFISDTVSTLPLRARLTWIGLWTHCDDYGRCRNNVKLVKAAVWPLDEVSIKDVEIDLNTLADRGLIYRYTVDGKNYLAVTSWSEHQKVDRPSKSTIPKPPVDNPARESLASTREPLAQEGKGRERKGREGTREPAQEPPLKCEKHEHDPNPPPCGRCADARKAREAWQQQRRNGHPSTRSVAEAIASARGEP